MTRVAVALAALFSALIVATGSAHGGAEPVVRITGGTALQALPDFDGKSRLRIRNDVMLLVRFDSRWSLVGAGNLRFSQRLFEPSVQGGVVWAGQGLDEADLHRLAIRFDTPEVGFKVGRFVRTALTGRHKVDGAAIEIGAGSLPVGFEAWVGRLGHFEPLTPSSTFGGGFEARITPLSPNGLGWSGLAIRAGYDIYSGVTGLRHVGHAGVSYRDGRGGSVAGGATVGFLAPPEDSDEGSDLGVRGWFRARAMPTSRLVVGGGVRWEGLDPVGVPESSVAMMEAQVPGGYLIADGLVGIRFDRLKLRLEGGPTISPRPGGTVRMGGRGRLSAHVPTSDRSSLAPFATAAMVGGSSYYGGGVTARGTLKILRLGGEVGVYQFIGLNSRPTLVAEGRFDAQLKLPLPARVEQVGGELLVVADVGGGANHLLAPWIRVGGGIRGSFAAWGADR